MLPLKLGTLNLVVFLDQLVGPRPLLRPPLCQLLPNPWPPVVVLVFVVMFVMANNAALSGTAMDVDGPPLMMHIMAQLLGFWERLTLWICC